MVAEKASGLLQRSGLRLAGVAVAALTTVAIGAVAVWRFARPDPQLYTHLSITHTPVDNDVSAGRQLSSSNLTGARAYPQDGSRGWDNASRTVDDAGKEAEYGHCDCIARFEQRIQTSVNGRHEWLDCSALGASYVVRSAGCTLDACETACQSAGDYLGHRARIAELTIPEKGSINASDCQRSTLQLNAYYEHGNTHWCAPAPPLYPQGGEIHVAGVPGGSISGVIRAVPHPP